MAPGSLLILFTDPGFMLFNSLQRHIQQIQITNHRGLSKCQEKQTEKNVFIYVSLNKKKRKNLCASSSWNNH